MIDTRMVLRVFYAGLLLLAVAGGSRADGLTILLTSVVGAHDAAVVGAEADLAVPVASYADPPASGDLSIDQVGDGLIATEGPFFSVEAPLLEPGGDGSLPSVPASAESGLVDPSQITLWRDALTETEEEETQGTAIPEPPGYVLVMAIFVLIGLMNLLRSRFDTLSISDDNALAQPVRVRR